MKALWLLRNDPLEWCTPWKINGWNLRNLRIHPWKRKIIWTKPSWLQVLFLNLWGCRFLRKNAEYLLHLGGDLLMMLLRTLVMMIMMHTWIYIIFPRIKKCLKPLCLTLSGPQHASGTSVLPQCLKPPPIMKHCLPPDPSYKWIHKLYNVFCLSLVDLVDHAAWIQNPRHRQLQWCWAVALDVPQS